MKNKPETHSAAQRCAPPPATESPLRQVPARRKLKGPRGVARKHTAPPQGRRAAVENIGPGGSFPTRGAARRPRPRPSRACPGMRMFPPPLPWIPHPQPLAPTPTSQHARCRTAKQMPECDAADWCGLGFRPSHGRCVPTLHSTDATDAGAGTRQIRGAMRPARTARVKRPHVCAAALPFSPQLLGTMCERRAGGVVITGGGDGRPEEAEEAEEVEEDFPLGYRRSRHRRDLQEGCSCDAG